MSTMREWLLSGNFMPYGHCYLWRPDVLWLHAGSDALMASAQAEVDARTAELVVLNARLREEIAARESTASALRESENRFRATFENAAIGIAHLATDGRWLQVNDVLCKLTGYSREELLRRTFEDITHPADLEKDWAQAHRLLNREIDSYALEKRYIRKDQSTVWVMVTVSLNRKPDGEPDYFISVVADISERKRAEAELQQQDLRTRLSLEASGAATWAIDYTQASVEQFDVRGCELAGLDPAQRLWPAGTFCELLHPEDRKKMQAASRETHQVQGPGPTSEYRIRRPGGEMRWLQGAGIVQRDADGHPTRFIGVSIDITDRKRLEEELRNTIQKLADNDRRKDEFLATLAHELRNPLAPIANGLQIIKLSGPATEPLKRVTEMMERQLRHLVRLVDDLLDVSRISRGKAPLRRERLALRQVLTGALESSWTAADAERLELITEMPDDVTVEGDRDRLTQVFSNILSNAAKYTGGKGKIWVSLRREGEEAVVSVRDTGVGIPAGELENVFEMFSQLKPPGHGEGGLGIGLALVRQLVLLHGGRVEARSPGAGLGSEFILRLPAADQHPAGAAPSPAHSMAHPSAAPRKVLVVDDSYDSASSLSSLLQLMGHDVRQAADGFEAIEAVRDFEPDLVFMDIGMPRLNGLEATQRIRELPLSRQPSIVALTGWGQESDRLRSERAGIDQHLIKPIDTVALREVLQATQLRSP